MFGCVLWDWDERGKFGRIPEMASSAMGMAISRDSVKVDEDDDDDDDGAVDRAGAGAAGADFTKACDVGNGDASDSFPLVGLAAWTALAPDFAGRDGKVSESDEIDATYFVCEQRRGTLKNVAQEASQVRSILLPEFKKSPGVIIPLRIMAL
jgi:hypothetical protein